MIRCSRRAVLRASAAFAGASTFAIPSIVHGESDEYSYQAAEKKTTGYDLHATILHLMGIDHTRLTFRHNGIDRRLTDVHGEVIREVLA